MQVPVLPSLWGFGLKLPGREERGEKREERGKKLRGREKERKGEIEWERGGERERE